MTTFAGLVIGLLTTPVVSGTSADAHLSKVKALLDSGQEPVRIVCFGDSITGVYYHTGGRRAWCDMLGIALQRIYPKAKLEMINAGLSGHSTVNALSRIKKDVLDRKPHLVVVMFGMNDVVRVPRPTFCENLRSIVRQCRDAGAEVVLCTPNAIYPEDPGRPVDRLASYAAAVRDVGVELAVPVVDCHAAYEGVKTKDPIAWMVMMSDAIHPAMTGHKRFAEEITRVISGRRISLADVGPPRPAIPHLLDRLTHKKVIKLIAMEPYDTIVPRALVELDAAARVYVHRWPTQGKSVGELEAWAKGIRDGQPDLVLVAIPPEMTAEPQEPFIRSYHGILNWCLSFDVAQWDTVVVLPSVTRPPAASPPSATERLIRDITLGHDLHLIERRTGDNAPPERILLEWLKAEAASARP